MPREPEEGIGPEAKKPKSKESEGERKHGHIISKLYRNGNGDIL